MKIEMGKKYQTKDGKPVRILCVDMEHDDYSVVALASVNGKEIVRTYTADGRYSLCGMSPERDLIEVVEPVTIEQWVNVYKDGSIGANYDSYASAASVAGSESQCVARVKLTGTYKPGDGLDKEAVR